ncbi:protein BTG3 isoform X1 [Artibeus jamaicensis]|uniref:protein BTG3 isoform X1 n=1 Tax=Artibeus jamaicensis TaxID=9417 RepID=UPI00235AFB17|nr:protein BTG3 isoform X1 [Artibeus jamaicensis]
MKNEIAAVVFFFTRLVRKHDKLKKEAVERFAEKLTLILQEKYKNHWYPEKPSKGQAYRCIRVNKFQRVDPDVLKACENSCILYSDLGLPKELTLWVDPCEVCCRYGEKNNAFIVASFENEDENKDEISKKVTRALDKVTSDYHSGSSSSDEETTSKEVEVKSSSVTATPGPMYQDFRQDGGVGGNTLHPCTTKAKNNKVLTTVNATKPHRKPTVRSPKTTKCSAKPISELIFPPLPIWHPLPRRKPGMYRGNGHQNHYPPPVPFGYPNQGRKNNKPYRPIPVTWVPPPGMHCDRNQWINPHMLAPH